MSKKPCFRGPFKRQHGKGVERLLQPERRHLYQNCQSLWSWLRWKKSLLVIYKSLRLFVDTLTADDKHYWLNRDNLTEPIQMKLSQKQKQFSEFFFAFSKSILISKHLPRKDDPHNWCISRITCSEKHYYINV